MSDNFKQKYVWDSKSRGWIVEMAALGSLNGSEPAAEQARTKGEEGGQPSVSGQQAGQANRISDQELRGVGPVDVGNGIRGVGPAAEDNGIGPRTAGEFTSEMAEEPIEAYGWLNEPESKEEHGSQHPQNVLEVSPENSLLTDWEGREETHSMFRRSYE
ncbi:hypothetical protein BK138_33800 [Paenibacillus rhizosphaerae]|uniref:Uncharacterized protein n=1 Tax=Paenibacillus rhizosphaerae TaxID=297318 RepID=A0A1R1E156_9BACL|nr:hypothetical protein [Paenibacillus rhizosphaerae]OMF45563.1 hypothetical protein BK138_33800 [Paenibacillus rhizosphaerae]